MAFIEVSDICKDYGSGDTLVHALKNVSFEVDKGQIVTILGASGAGKTTLLNILGGMDTPTSGTFSVDSKRIDGAKEKQLEDFRRNDIGFVFQFYNLLGNLTAFENVDIAASIVKDPLDPHEVLAKVGLSERENNFPSQLSGGEQQRISIARAIVKNPKLLLCDEPTGALDSKTGIEIVKLLYSIANEYGTTIIIVTHNSAITGIGDRLIRIADGEIVENSLLTRPSSVEDIKW